MYNIYSDNCNKKACIHKYTTFKLKPLINCYCITKYFQFKLICTVELKVWIPSDIFPLNAIAWALFGRGTGGHVPPPCFWGWGTKGTLSPPCFTGQDFFI